jgi:hypothetical protein
MKGKAVYSLSDCIRNEDSRGGLTVDPVEKKFAQYKQKCL